MVVWVWGSFYSKPREACSLAARERIIWRHFVIVVVFRVARLVPLLLSNTGYSDHAT